ncbi:MAG: hypothetical protein WBA22_06395 [Candidatus Methanofastidiosia archaeon]
MTEEQRPSLGSEGEKTEEEQKSHDAMEILLKETIRKREEMLLHMENNANRVFALLSTSLILIGAYVTSLAFLGKDGQVPIFPFTSAVFLSAGGFAFSLAALYPRNLDIIIKPSEIYNLKDKQKAEITDKLIDSYLAIENRLLLIAKEKPFFSKMIIIFLMSSVFEFIFAVLLSIDIHDSRFLWMISDISLAIPFALVFIIIFSYFKYRRERNNLERYLEGYNGRG